MYFQRVMSTEVLGGLIRTVVETSVSSTTEEEFIQSLEMVLSRLNEMFPES
jgi:hypothetical protein